MLRTHLKFLVRVFLKDKFFSLLNILGLALGIAISMLLLLVLQNDLTYDKHYLHHKRLYRLGFHYQVTGVDVEIAYAPRELGPVLREEYPELQAVVPVKPSVRTLVRYEGKNETVALYEEHVIQTDSTYFKAFNHEFISGDTKTSLNDLHGVVITASCARRYFGNDEPLNKALIIDNTPWIVTAVIKDLPENTHLKFDLLLSGLQPYREWAVVGRQPVSTKFWNPDIYLYLLVPEHYQTKQFLSKWTSVFAKHYRASGEQVEGQNTPIMEPLAAIHLHSELQDEEPHGNLTYLKAFSGIGIFIVLLACINYMNLSTAKAVNRATEIAVKKIVGSSRRMLLVVTLGESVLLSLISLIIAMGIVFAVLNGSPFNQLIGKNLTSDFLQNPLLLFGSLGMALSIGFVSGLYPAFYLTSIPAVLAVKGTFKNRKSSLVLRRVLITIQFSISIFVVACTLFMRDQIYFVQNKYLGFNKDNLLVLPIRDTLTFKNVPAVKNELLRNPNIAAVTSSHDAVGLGTSGGVMYGESEKGMTQQGGVLALFVGDDYLKAMGLSLISGRDFLPGPDADTRGMYIANESAVKLFGWGKDALGKKVSFWGGENAGQVIGVVKDFNVNSLHQGVDPMFIVKGHWNTGFLLVRLTGQHLQETIMDIQAKWSRADSNHPFEYFFLDQRFNEQYKDEVIQSKLLSILSYLCIFISLLGLIGLSTYTATQRTREIGVRKVLGASIPDIIFLLSGNVLVLVLLAAVLVFPVAYWVMGRWMENFAYRIELNYYAILLVTLAAMGLVFLTILFQSLKTARSNPIDSLKYE